MVFFRSLGERPLRLAVGLALLWAGAARQGWAIEPIRDLPFAQEYREAFRLADNNAANDVRAIAVDGQGDVWIATLAGVRQWRDGRWQAPAGDAVDGPAFDVTVDSAGTVWAAAWDGLYEYAAGELRRVTGPTPPVAKIVETAGELWAAGPRGVWRREAGEWQRVAGGWANSVNDLAVQDGNLWVATSMGLYQYRDGQTTRLAATDELQSCDVRALAVTPNGQQLLVGTSGGIDLYQAGRRVRSLGVRHEAAGQFGLPSTDVQALVLGGDGQLWVGAKLGLARGTADGSTWSLRHSQRWLPNDDVRDIALTADAAYIATAAGVAVLRSRPMTLADKAAHYQALLEARHVRPPGLVEKCLLPQPGSVERHAPVDTDNDGSFTAMYVAAEAYRFAVTGADDARRNAAAGYAALEFLQTVTGTDGFIARTVVPADWTEMADANHVYTPQENAAIWREDPRWKPVDVRWRKSADGRWLWKGDTSADEIGGHYLGFAAYHDLAANEQEKRRVAQHVRRVTDYLMAGGYDLRDTDGQPTRWGVWSPARLNGDPDWLLDRGVNSVQLLSFLWTAQHVTGDEKYARAVRELAERHGYARNTLTPQTEDPATYTHIDSELLAHAFPALVTYERDPVRRSLYLTGLDRWFALNRRDQSPYYNFVYAALRATTPELDFDQQACVDYLRDVPWDMVQWTMDQRGREDVRLVRRPQIERWQVDRLLPPSERAILKWDSNPYDAVAGEDSRTENCATYWLLPYWMGRYYGIIGPPESP